jgi:hypothetical protein
MQLGVLNSHRHENPLSIDRGFFVIASVIMPMD